MRRILRKKDTESILILVVKRLRTELSIGTDQKQAIMNLLAFESARNLFDFRTKIRPPRIKTICIGGIQTTYKNQSNLNIVVE